MSAQRDTGRYPTEAEFAEALRNASLPLREQQTLPSFVAANRKKLSHINTYGELPQFYIDRPFECVDCGKREIWKAADQKWYYEETKGHIDARAIRCHACRMARKPNNRP